MGADFRAPKRGYQSQKGPVFSPTSWLTLKKHIIIKLQKLYSPPRNLRAGNKLFMLLLKKTSLHRWFIAHTQNILWRAWVVILKYAKENFLCFDIKFLWKRLKHGWKRNNNIIISITYQSLQAFGHRLHYQVNIKTNLKLFAKFD